MRPTVASRTSSPSLRLPGDDAEELRRVGQELQQQLERAVTSAFGPPFLMAAFFALAALCAVALTRSVEP